MALTALGNEYTPMGRMLDEKVFVNGIVGLHATGGSTNHTMHVVAMAAAAGIKLTWQDFSDLAEVVPLLTRVYPNGKADVNHFHAAGGMAFAIRELLGAGLLHADVETVFGGGLDAYTAEPTFEADGRLAWREGAAASGDEAVLRPVSAPFHATGGLKVLDGDLGPCDHQDLGHRGGAATRSRRRRACSTRRKTCRRRSGPESSWATWWRWSASRAPRPTACRSFTS